MLFFSFFSLIQSFLTQEGQLQTPGMQFLNECGQAIGEQFVKPPDNVVELSLMSAFDSLFVWWGKSSVSGSGKIWRYEFSILCLHLLSSSGTHFRSYLLSIFTLSRSHLHFLPIISSPLTCTSPISSLTSSSTVYLFSFPYCFCVVIRFGSLFLWIITLTFDYYHIHFIVIFSVTGF